MPCTGKLGAKATLTVVFGEGKDAEVIDKREIAFTRSGVGTKRFRVEGAKVEELAVEPAKVEVKK